MSISLVGVRRPLASHLLKYGFRLADTGWRRLERERWSVD